MRGHIFSLILDSILDVIYFWDDSDTQRMADINNARKKVLTGHDDILIDSSKEYLLLCTAQGLYLVSRSEAWKSKLGATEEALYAKKGNRSFPRIRRALP